MKLLMIIRIIIDDKKYKQECRNDRVDAINSILFNRGYCTKPYIIGGTKYIVEYSKGRFWYDHTPITIKNIIDKFSYWHVHHWLVYPSGSKCGFQTSIVPGYFSKKNIYKFLEQESNQTDRIINKLYEIQNKNN